VQAWPVHPAPVGSKLEHDLAHHGLVDQIAHVEAKQRADVHHDPKCFCIVLHTCGTALPGLLTLCHLSRASEEDNVTVKIGDLEPAQTIRCVFERLAKLRATLGKFGG
jgi:hypothetical protein